MLNLCDSIFVKEISILILQQAELVHTLVQHKR